MSKPPTTWRHVILDPPTGRMIKATRRMTPEEIAKAFSRSDRGICQSSMLSGSGSYIIKWRPRR